MDDVNEVEETLDLVSLKRNRLEMLEDELEEVKEAAERQLDIVREVREKEVNIKKEIEGLKREVFIVKGSLVRLIKEEKSFWGSVKIPGDMRGEVVEDDMEGGKVRVLDEKIGKEFIIDVFKLVEIDEKEYHKYLYEGVFKRNNRAYLEYREGDIVVSKLTGNMRIVGYSDFYNEQELLEGMLDKGGYFYKTSWVPLYFVENIVEEGIVRDITGRVLGVKELEK